MRLVALAPVLLAAFAADPALAGSPADSTSSLPTKPDSSSIPQHLYVLPPLIVRGRIDDLTGTAESASQGHVGREDLQQRPISREGELLETVPGLILTQHSGDGKANQMFLRGFNLDHGTDFATLLEGMPLNLPTHAHGQGYTDLNFLIPEVVDHVDFRKGVYYSDVGDFSSAGTAHLRLLRSFDRPFVKLETGQNGYLRAVGAGSRPAGPGALLAAVELKGYDGPWERPENLDKASGLARYTWRTKSGHDFSVLALGYKNDWNSSDQIPLRVVDAGAIDAFGQIDSTLGGNTDRLSLSAEWKRAGATSSLRADVFAVRYRLDLFSDFTYFLSDSLRGDQFEQLDHRSIFGGGVESLTSVEGLGRTHRLTLGLQTRTDAIDEVGLFRTEERRRVGTVRDDAVVESTGGLYASLATPWTSRLRTDIGLRGDVFLFEVHSHSLAANSGHDTDAIVSPKLGAALTVRPGVELYANAGLGFHSNDARGATIAIDPSTGEAARPVNPLVRSRGAELGLRLQTVEGLRSTISAWALRLDSELVFSGDGGTTEPSFGSVRSGVELANFWEPTRSLAVDADIAVSRGRFEGAPPGEDRIPGALESVVAAGLRWDAPVGFRGALRVRHLGEYALIEDNSVRAKPTTLVNVSAGRDVAHVRFDVELLNVLDADARDIQYYYASRLPGEPSDGVEDIHFHPVEPRQVRVAATVPF